MEIYIDNRSEQEIEAGILQKIESVIKSGLERASVTTNANDGVEVSVSFVTPEEMRELNRDYRENDAVTDVLSFPACDNPLEDYKKKPEGIPFSFGDMVICPKRAEEQAAEYGHAFLREMCFLAAHGTLHLLGYDHEDEAGEEAMTREQEAILTALGVTR